MAELTAVRAIEQINAILTAYQAASRYVLFYRSHVASSHDCQQGLLRLLPHLSSSPLILCQALWQVSQLCSELVRCNSNQLAGQIAALSIAWGQEAELAIMEPQTSLAETLDSNRLVFLQLLYEQLFKALEPLCQGTSACEHYRQAQTVVGVVINRLWQEEPELRQSAIDSLLLAFADFYHNIPSLSLSTLDPGLHAQLEVLARNVTLPLSQVTISSVLPVMEGFAGELLDEYKLTSEQVEDSSHLSEHARSCHRLCYQGGELPEKQLEGLDPAFRLRVLPLLQTNCLLAKRVPPLSMKVLEQQLLPGVAIQLNFNAVFGFNATTPKSFSVHEQYVLSFTLILDDLILKLNKQPVIMEDKFEVKEGTQQGLKVNYQHQAFQKTEETEKAHGLAQMALDVTNYLFSFAPALGSKLKKMVY